VLGRLRLVMATRELPQCDHETGDLLLADLHAAPEAVVRQWVVVEVRRILGLEPADAIDPRQGFSELGMDSLMAVELKNRLAAGLSIGLPATLSFDYSTIDALTTYLGERLSIPPADKSDPADDPGYAVRCGELADAAQRDAVRVGERELPDRDGVLRKRRLELPFVRQADPSIHG
jgi:acyl carrier protein